MIFFYISIFFLLKQKNLRVRIFHQMQVKAVLNILVRRMFEEEPLSWQVKLKLFQIQVHGQTGSKILSKILEIYFLDFRILFRYFRTFFRVLGTLFGIWVFLRVFFLGGRGDFSFKCHRYFSPVCPSVQRVETHWSKELTNDSNKKKWKQEISYYMYCF